MDIRKTITTLLRDGFILVFNQDKLDVVKTAQALIKAGVNNMEVTCRISEPLEKMKRLREELPDFVVGAASLIDSPEMLAVYNKANPGDPLPSIQEVVDAGVSFLVSAANFRDETYEKFAGKLAMIPGCGTVTEIVSQFSKGANLCKVFPAKQLGGPAFVKAIDPAIHKTISLVPTGGTNPGNIPALSRMISLQPLKAQNSGRDCRLFAASSRLLIFLTLLHPKSLFIFATRQCLSCSMPPEYVPASWPA